MSIITRALDNDWQVRLSPMAKDGTVYVSHTGLAHPILMIGVGPLSDRELGREQIRHQVRTGLADVLAWIGEEVGEPPERTGRGQAIYDRLSEYHRATTPTPPTTAPREDMR